METTTQQQRYDVKELQTRVISLGTNALALNLIQVQGRLMLSFTKLDKRGSRTFAVPIEKADEIIAVIKELKIYAK
jgi:hypothetical protein